MEHKTVSKTSHKGNSVRKNLKVNDMSSRYLLLLPNNIHHKHLHKWDFDKQYTNNYALGSNKHNNSQFILLDDTRSSGNFRVKDANSKIPCITVPFPCTEMFLSTFYTHIQDLQCFREYRMLTIFFFYLENINRENLCTTWTTVYLVHLKTT